MQKLNYIPTPASKNNTDRNQEDEPIESKKIQRLEVASEKKRNEMDFSKICETEDLPPDLEPAE